MNAIVVSGKMDPFYAADVGVELLWDVFDLRRRVFNLVGFTAALYCDGVLAGTPFTLTVVPPGQVRYVVSVANTFPPGTYTALIKVSKQGSEFRSDPFVLTSMATSVAGA